MAIQIEIQQLQSGLPQCLNQVEAGDTFVVCRDHVPIAEIRPIQESRPLGLAKGEIEFLANLDEPLPEDVIDAFEGKTT